MLYVSIKNYSVKNVRSDFKKFAEQLATSKACFTSDSQYAQLTGQIEEPVIKQNLILFFLAHSENDKLELSKKIGDINSELNFPFDKIYLIDNSQLDFLYQSYLFAKSRFSKGHIEYFYPETGLNTQTSEGRRYAGKILPVEFINSRIIPFRITEGDKKSLLITIKEGFDEDNLTRTVGLSQSLTAGWCNKIIIAFPDYRTQDHSQIEDAVRLRFLENNYADMVEVATLSSSYKSLESRVQIDYQEAPEEPPSFNIDKMLPYGDYLRQLLTQSYIQKSDLRTLLYRRGIYTHKSITKNDLVPLLSTTLISPNEFEYLRHQQYKKVTSNDILDYPVFTNKEMDTHEGIQNMNVPVDDIVKGINPHTEIIERKPFILDEKGCIRLKVKTKTKQYAKD